MSAALVEASSKAEIETTVRAWRSASAQPGPSGRSRIGSAWTSIDGVELAGGQRLLDLARGCGRRRPSAKPGPAPGRQPTSRRPRALAPSGTPITPAPSASASSAVAHSSSAASAASPSGAAADPLAPDDHGLAGAQLAGDPLGVGRGLALRRRPVAELGGERGEERGRARRARSGRSPRRRRRARSGARRRPPAACAPWRTALRSRRSRIGIELQRVGADDQHRLGRGRGRRSRPRARGPRGRASAGGRKLVGRGHVGRRRAPRTIRWTR